MQTMRDAIGLSSQTNGTQIQSATIGNINPAQVQAQQIQDSNVNVFAEGIKGLQQTAGAIYEGVQDRKKLVALDASTQYNVGMQHIDKYYSDIEATGKALTSKDISSRMEWKQKFHSDMVGRTVDGVVSENYNKDFDDEIVKKGFIEPAVGYLNKSYSADAKQFQELKKLENITMVKKTIDIRGVNITQYDVSELIKVLDTSGVEYPEELVYGEIANNRNSLYSDKFGTGVLSPAIKPYLQNGVLTNKGISKLFNDVQKGFIHLDENGEYTKLDKNMTDEAYDKMKKDFNSFFNSINSDDGINTALWKISTKKAKEALDVGLNLTQQEYENAINLYTEIMANGSKSQKESAMVTMADIDSQQDKNSNAKKTVQSILSKDIIDAKTVQNLKSGFKTANGNTVDGALLQKIMDKERNIIADSISKVDVMDENFNEPLLKKEFAKLEKTQTISSESELVKNYNTLYTNSGSNFANAKDARLSVYYAIHRNESEGNSLDYTYAENKKLLGILTQDIIVDDEKLEGERLENARLIMFQDERKRFIASTRNNSNITVKMGVIQESLDRLADGGLDYFSTLNAEVSRDFQYEIYEYLKSTNQLDVSPKQLDTIIGKMNTVHVGTISAAFLSSKDMVVIPPQGVSEHDYKNAVNRIVESSKDKYGQGYGDLNIVSKYIAYKDKATGKQSKDWITEISYKGVFLGSVDSSATRKQASITEPTYGKDIITLPDGTVIKYQKKTDYYAPPSNKPIR